MMGVTMLKKMSFATFISIVAVISVSAAPLGDMLIQNPSFEIGWDNSTNSPSYWSTPDSAWTGNLDTLAYEGRYSYKLTTKKTDGWSGVFSDSIEIRKNKTYFIRTHMKYENVKQSHIKIEKFDSDNNEWGELIQIPSGQDGSSGWKEYYAFINLPKDTTKTNDTAKIRFVLNAGNVKDKDAGNATTWFDDIELIDPDVVNPTKYTDELNLNKGESWQINDDFALFLEDATRESASMSLIYRGSPLVSQIINKGEWTTFEYDKNKLLIFRLDNLYSSTGIGKAWLKEILAGSLPAEMIKAPKLDISAGSPDYAYSGGNVTLNVSVANRGEMAFAGDVEVTAKLDQSHSVKDSLKLDPGKSKNYSFDATAPEKPDEYKVSGILKTRYSSLKDEEKIIVKALNPVVTTLSSDLREDNGIRGTVIIGSAYPDTLVEWNTTADVQVFRVLENGKESVYSKELPVKSRTFDIGISYNDFFKDSGRYLVTINVGGMENDRFFEIAGPSGVYKPPGTIVFPPTVVSNSMYPQLMLLLIGMIAALSVRNHMHPRSWSLPLDFVAVGCGAMLFIAGMLQSMNDITSKGMLLAGIGFALIMAKEKDARVNVLLLRGSHIHDFIGLMLIFMSASYLVFLIPQWSVMLTVGTLIVYYTLINLHGERKHE